MANGWGGRRPGAGRKADPTKERQKSNREKVIEFMTPEKQQKMMEVAYAQAIDPEHRDAWRAREWLSSFIHGGHDSELIEAKLGGGDTTVNVIMPPWRNGWEPPELPPADPMPTDDETVIEAPSYRLLED